MRFRSRLRIGAIALVLAATAWLGLTEGWIATRTGVTVGERVATGTQLAYGLFGLLALAGLLARRRWVLVLLVLWGLALTATAALAPVVWGRREWLSGLVSGTVTAIVAALVLWGGRAHVDPATRASPRRV